jgi:anaerobic selenocysteine-containing dehydrogenase
MLEYQNLRAARGSRRAHDRVHQTVCPECPLGCGISLYLMNGSVVDLQGRSNHPVNCGGLCARPLASIRNLMASHRLTEAKSRPSFADEYQGAESPAALMEELAERLRKIKEQHGAESLAIACDPAAGLDFYLAAQRFAAMWGTPFVLSPWRLPARFSASMGPPPCWEWPLAPWLLLVEADLAASHPVAMRWLLAARDRGAKVIVLDSSFSATMAHADQTAFLTPRSGNLAGVALAKAMLEAESEAIDKEPLKPLTDGSWEELDASTGVTPERWNELGSMLARLGPGVVLTGQDLAFQPSYEIWPAMSKAMGESQGAGWYPLGAGLPPLNAAAGLDSQASPEITCEAAGVPDARTRERLQSIKALICSGDCLKDFAAPLAELLPELELLVYFGSHATATYHQCHLAFPSPVWPENDFIHFSDDHLLQWGERALEPPEQCQNGLRFWQNLSVSLGWGNSFSFGQGEKPDSLTDFLDSLLQQSPGLAGLSIEQIRQAQAKEESIFLPAAEPAAGPTEAIQPAGTAAESPSQDEPDLFPLYTRAALQENGCHAGPGNVNGASGAWVQINPRIAQALGIESGDEVVVSGPMHSSGGRAQLSRLVPPRLVGSPAGLAERRVVLHKPEQSPESARAILKELFL